MVGIWQGFLGGFIGGNLIVSYTDQYCCDKCLLKSGRYQLHEFRLCYRCYQIYSDIPSYIPLEQWEQFRKSGGMCGHVPFL